MRFLALYSGSSLADARLVAVASDPDIVREFATLLPARQSPDDDDSDDDEVSYEPENGRRRAFKIVAGDRHA